MKVKIGKHRETAPGAPKASQGESYLVDETFLMEQERRQTEQQGHRQLAKVNVVEHQEPRAPGAPEGELQNNIKEHPWLDSQRHAGIDKNETPNPSDHIDADKDLYNAKLEQELQYKLKHNLMPKTAPEPQP